ncbi:hypothetical protein [Paenibacillus lautus]|uniref:hypothetical protein n=1 Tax=Paenibacillus lautus TaxID=1401 RepID=UPI003D9AA388
MEHEATLLQMLTFINNTNYMNQLDSLKDPISKHSIRPIYQCNIGVSVTNKKGALMELDMPSVDGTCTVAFTGTLEE